MSMERMALLLGLVVGGLGVIVGAFVIFEGRAERAPTETILMGGSLAFTVWAVAMVAGIWAVVGNTAKIAKALEARR